jgi:hypothetical protein
MNEVRDGLRTLWERVFAWLPQLVGALVILLLSYLIASGAQRLAETGLGRVGFDERVHGGKAGELLERVLPSPSRFVGLVVFWVIFVWGITVAASVLGVPALNEIVRGIYGYIPNILGSILIFLAAGAIAAAVDGFIGRALGDTPTGKVATVAAPVVIMGIATFMILDQLRIAPAIVTITYAGLMGSIFLGLALAFGLGGRDVAAQMLQRAYEAGQRKDAQFKKDLAAAREQAKREGGKLKDQIKRAP